MDQVIIQRAAAKMELTNTVIEGGQVGGASGWGRWVGQVEGAGGWRFPAITLVGPVSLLSQFSLMDSTAEGSGSTNELVEMLKFGLGALLESSDSEEQEEDVNFEEILGRSEHGEWVEPGPGGKRGRAALEGGSGETEGVFAFGSLSAAIVCVGMVCVCVCVCGGGHWVVVVVVVVCVGVFVCLFS